MGILELGRGGATRLPVEGTAVALQLPSLSWTLHLQASHHPYPWKRSPRLGALALRVSAGRAALQRASAPGAT